MLALYCPFGVQGSSSSQLDKYRHWHDHQCSLVTRRSCRQLDHVIESKNTSFTVTHLLWNKRSAQQDWKGEKNDWTFTMSKFIPTHQRDKVRQRPSLVCSSLQVFSRCSSVFPGVILALLLASFFQVRPLTQHPLVGSTPASEGTGRVQSVKIDRTASLLKLRSTFDQPLLNDLLAVSLVTGKKKMWRKLSVR